MRVDGGKLTRRDTSVSHANAQRSWSERSSIVLELRFGGVTGFGEAAPLPGYSRDDLGTCAAELDACWERLPEIDVGADLRETLRGAVTRSGVRAPAAVFALETALLDLIARTRNEPAWALLRGGEEATPLALSALAEGTTVEELVVSAERARARGLRVVKVKVGGPDSARRDSERLHAIRARLGDSIALRLDANQSLSSEGLAGSLERLAAFDPELLEEPTRPEDLAAVRSSPIPLALDESLMLDDWRERILRAAERGAHKAVVLKPMALGGFDRCLAMADLATEVGLDIIVTHVFDGPIGTAAAACFALAVRGNVRPSGLDCHGRFDPSIRPATITATEIVPALVAGIGAVGFG